MNSTDDDGWVRLYDCSRVNAWMSATVEFQQPESECFGMSAVAVCHVHTSWSRENVESWMSLWRTWEVFVSFTFFVSGKGYRSKTRIEKTNTNVAYNNNSLPVNNCIQIMLESFQETQQWLHTSSLRFYFTCNFQEQNIPFTPIFRHIRTRCAFVDIFEFATNKAFDVCIGMSMLFWLGSFLKSRR